MWHLPRHGRGLKLFGNRKSMDDALPLDLGLLEIDEKTDGLAGGSQIVETLRGVLAGEPLHTFQLDRQHAFDEEIGKVFSHRVPLLGDCKGSFGGSPDAAKAEFSEQCPLVDSLEKSGAQVMGDLKDGTQHAFGQRIDAIRVHLRSSAAKVLVPRLRKDLK